MANTKISQLTALTNPTWNEEFVYALNNANGKVTLDTMKTYTQTWTQAELVSWTNIKTINSQSILWSWNLVISWWGWSWEDNDYDAVVDVNGGWDYTSISDAITAGIKRIYVKNWTYILSSQILSTWDFKLVWESRNWVIIDVSYWTRSGTIFTLTSDTVSQANSFLFKNLTFNISYSWEYWYFIMFWWMWAWDGFLKMSDCNINVTQAINWCNFYITWWSGNDTLVENCYISIYPTTWNFAWLWFLGISRYSVCTNSTIVVDASGTIWTSWIDFNCNSNWTYIWCDFQIWMYHQKAWDVAKLWCSYAANCSFSTSSYANIQIYWYCENCSFPNLWKNANFDSALNTAVTWKTITIWKPSTSYTVWQYVMSWNSSTLAKCIEAHTSWTSFDASKFENVYGDIYIQGTLHNCTVNAWWNVVISWVAPYNDTVVQPALSSSVSGSSILFSKPSWASETFANLILLSNRWFNDCRVIAYDTTTTHIYLWWESAEFVWNRITSYEWDIYSWWYWNVITNNIFNYVTWQTTPTITQVAWWGSEIANNIIRWVVDWTQF